MCTEHTNFCGATSRGMRYAPLEALSPRTRTVGSFGFIQSVLPKADPHGLPETPPILLGVPQLTSLREERLVRQEVITTELLDVVTGSEAVLAERG